MNKNQTKSVVAYLRTATNIQGETNINLEIQKKSIEKYAKENNLLIHKTFIELNNHRDKKIQTEFQNMIEYIKNSNEFTFTILIYSYDRISRSLQLSINTIKELKYKFNIDVISVSENTVINNVLKQNIYELFFEYDKIQKK